MKNCVTAVTEKNIQLIRLRTFAYHILNIGGTNTVAKFTKK